MNRQQFDHAIRATGAVVGVDELIVIGSQAVHGSMAELPIEAQRSMEVDIVPPDDADGTLADVIDGSIGEASMFHETFGYYSQGVSERTAILPNGWRKPAREVRVAGHQRRRGLVSRAPRPVARQGDRQP